MQTIQIEGRSFELVPQYSEATQVGDTSHLIGYLLKPIETQPEKRWDTQIATLDNEGYRIAVNLYGVSEPAAEAIREAVEALMGYIHNPYRGTTADHDNLLKAAVDAYAAQKEGNTHV